jgi:hypothetical protein
MLAAAVIFFCLGLLFRVLMGPVSLGPFADEIHVALKRVLPDFDVSFDNAALEWERAEGRIDLVILGTRVFDRGQHIIAQAPKAEIGLAVGPLLHGRIAIDRIALVGVQLTLVHTREGALRLGFEAGKGGEDVLQRIREAISHGHGTGPPLDSFAVRSARLAFYDEATEAFVIAPEADLQVAAPKRNSRDRGGLDANLAARFEISGKPGRIYATIHLPGHGDDVTGDLSITGLNLGALSHDGKGFAFLSPLALTADVTGSWTIRHGTELRFADFGIGGTGYVTGFGRPLHVRSLRFVGRYDGVTGRLLVDDATVSGEQGQAHLTGNADLKFAPQGGLLTSAFVFVVDRIALNLPGTMAHAMTLGRAMLAGSYNPTAKSIALDQVTLAGGPLSAALSGRIGFAPNQSPETDLDGKVDAIAVRDLLSYWPLHVVPGVRSWIAENVTAGRLGPVLVRLRIPAGGLQRPALPENAVSVSFPLVGATITYLSGLTPLTNAVGTGLLTGDTFKANLSSAVAGPLSVSDGHVTIANLHIHGTPALVTAHVTGTLPQVLTLLDMKPLRYPTRFHVNIASTRGSAALDGSFRIPTIKRESVDAVGISVKGTVDNVALSLGPHTRIANGHLLLSVDNSGLQASGNVVIGSAALDVDWAEIFKPPGAVSTRVKVRGQMDEAALAEFGFPSGSFVSGPLGVEAHLEGYRGKIQNAAVDLDLGRATLSTDLLGWTKPPGTPATLHIAAHLDASGNPASADLTLAGPNLSAHGTATFAADGALDTLAVPELRIGADDDFGVTLHKRGGAGLDLLLAGRSLDATGLLRRKPGNAARAAPQKPGEPFHLNVKLDRLVLRDGVTLSPFALDASGVGQRPATLSAMGGLAKAAPLKVSIGAETGGRHVDASAGDAGTLIKGFLGYSSVKGGTLSIQATLPPTTAPNQKSGGSPDISGEVIIRNCAILNQAFLARMLSSGSPGGQGIALDSIHIPFRISNDVVAIHDARASGPSIGVTADGYIDRASNQIALQGAVAPLYGINGLLGSIPVLGDVFVSKKGEGLFGITYTMQGSIDDPKLSTNPLSVLAPGILRRIFEGAAPTAPAPPPAAPTNAHTQ